MLWLNFILYSLIFLFLRFWVWQNDNEFKTKENKILMNNKIDPSTVFSTFDVDKLRKSVNNPGKSALILEKLPSLKLIRLKQVKILLHKVSKIN